MIVIIIRSNGNSNSNSNSNHYLSYYCDYCYQGRRPRAAGGRSGEAQRKQECTLPQSQNYYVYYTI